MKYNKTNQNSELDDGTTEVKKNTKDISQNAGYGSYGLSQLKNTFNTQNNNIEFQNTNMNNNYPQQNYHYPVENQAKGNERPLWSYREIKYDQNKEPMNTEDISNIKLIKQEIQPNILKKSNLTKLIGEDNNYFKDMKYQKVKVTKKEKNRNFIQPKMLKKGPKDDYEQQYKINYYENKQVNNQNIVFMENQNNNFFENNEINNNNDIKNEKNEQDGQDEQGRYNEQNGQYENNMNNEDEEGEIELAQKAIQDEYDKIIDYNEENYNTKNLKENKEKYSNNMQNNFNKNDDELQRSNYELDIENLAEAHSEENENNLEGKKNDNENNNILQNNRIRPQPAFNEIITQKVSDNVDKIKTFPEGRIEPWNCVADYTPN